MLDGVILYWSPVDSVNRSIDVPDSAPKPMTISLKSILDIVLPYVSTVDSAPLDDV